jgi:hypothetical protein
VNSANEGFLRTLNAKNPATTTKESMNPILYRLERFHADHDQSNAAAGHQAAQHA